MEEQRRQQHDKEQEQAQLGKDGKDLKDRFMPQILELVQLQRQIDERIAVTKLAEVLSISLVVLTSAASFAGTQTLPLGAVIFLIPGIYISFRCLIKYELRNWVAPA
ncbi:hypothetical protein GPECTOR_56g426 [Gonium pectorale]|uniref:Uncharacterized protein n=1 Tax=Gonium pectorale TaxID=33097 RepID=A0A150G617_GONPE|nr:hypothetical protein GPECTOR_56g426 [Gonium pectorale]|eukprot:KXZ45329.1 hypothetical protein GPECTOR_56g426 [Gonium pectorale]